MDLFERPESGQVERTATGQKCPLKYCVVHSMDRDAIYTAVLLATPLSIVAAGIPMWRARVMIQFFSGMAYADVEYDTGTTEATAIQNEGPPGSTPIVPTPPTPTDATALGSNWAFKTTGGTSHITQARSTRYRRIADDNALDATEVGTAEDLQEAIGVRDDGLDGAEIHSRNFEFTITEQLTKIDLPFIRDVLRKAPRLNSQPWRSFDVEEVLWLGADGNGATGSPATLAHQFLAGTIKVNESIGGITVPRIYPFDQVDVYYRQEKVGNRVVSVPRAVYVYKVYQTMEFRDLKIGG